MTRFNAICQSGGAMALIRNGQTKGDSIMRDIVVLFFVSK